MHRWRLYRLFSDYSILTFFWSFLCHSCFLDHLFYLFYSTICYFPETTSTFCHPFNFFFNLLFSWNLAVVTTQSKHQPIKIVNAFARLCFCIVRLRRRVCRTCPLANSSEIEERTGFVPVTCGQDCGEDHQRCMMVRPDPIRSQSLNLSMMVSGQGGVSGIEIAHIFAGWMVVFFFFLWW